MKFLFHFLNTNCCFVCLLLLASITLACSDDDNDDQVLFLWNQTGCADPWETGPTNSNEETSEAVVSYLSENGVENARIIRFEFDESVATSCLACSCTTGIVIYVETLETHSSTMEDLGFVKDL